MALLLEYSMLVYFIFDFIGLLKGEAHVKRETAGKSRIKTGSHIGS